MCCPCVVLDHGRLGRGGGRGDRKFNDHMNKCSYDAVQQLSGAFRTITL